jgi:NAD(P)-dependent dehydrogenase (short-subunit alcohol dehydrogenase family)
MKTFLVWGVRSELSEELCLELARGGRRLLVAGDNPEALTLLDATLAQSELHRYRTSCSSDGIAEWVKSQRVGLDGLVLFPEAPAPERSILLPDAELQPLLEASVLRPTQVMRELLPQLERGKKPKPIWIVLDWAATGTPLTGGWTEILLQTWRTYVQQLAIELVRQELVVNALFPGHLVSNRPAASADGGDALPETPLEQPSPRGALGVLAAARTTAQLLDATAGTLTGQLLNLGLPG